MINLVMPLKGYILLNTTASTDVFKIILRAEQSLETGRPLHGAEGLGANLSPAPPHQPGAIRPEVKHLGAHVLRRS